MVKVDKKWWLGSAVYHVYLRSFYDSNGDGVGDLIGLTHKLDYIESLGTSAVWLSPFYTSPMVDFGYDVSDYRGVDPLFGTLADFDTFLAAAHERGLKVIIDFIPNHTSDQHQWFKESAVSQHNARRDWYTWRDPAPDGGPPNNWKSVFGGSAWEFHAPTQQYYLHTFAIQQPDLNWDNPKVRAAMKAVVKFWLDRGVDGLRVDAVSWLSKDTRLRDDPLNGRYVEGEDDEYQELYHTFSCASSHLYDYLNELIDTVAVYDDRFIITEAYPDFPGAVDHYLNYYEHLHGNICAPFNFEFISFPWDAHTYQGFIDVYQESLLPGQPAIYNMGNHDQPRLTSRVGHQAARTAAMLLLTLPGMPVLYYGDELGMADAVIAPNQVRDPSASRKMGSRDPCRSPMPWDASPRGGFTSYEPWLPFVDDYENCNVESEARHPHSILNLYKTLLTLRNQNSTMKFGSYKSLNLGPGIYGFVRELDLERFTVVLNFTEVDTEVTSKALKGHLVLSTYLDHASDARIKDYLLLRPHEGVIIEAV